MPRGRFDPLNQAGSGGTSPLDAKMQPSPEEQCLEAEAKVHVALEQSAEAHVKGDASAGKLEQVDFLACCRNLRAVSLIWHERYSVYLSPVGTWYVVISIYSPKWRWLVQGERVLQAHSQSDLHCDMPC